MGTIEVGDHVMIGAQTIIMPGKRIGSHVIIAAGSVITRNVPDGTIVGGNPAKIIGDYYDLAKKRLSEDMPSNTDDIKTINNYFWGDKA
jgi:acetyltransferase-like isoleucine patch superfamily enzyme